MGTVPYGSMAACATGRDHTNFRGLLLASGFILGGDADHSWRLGLVTIVVMIATLNSRINPLFLLGAGGAIMGVFNYG